MSVTILNYVMAAVEKEQKKYGFGDLHFPTSPILNNEKTDAITTYKMVDESWLYTDNTSMLKRRSMPK